MRPRRLSEMAASLRGRLVGHDAAAASIVVDSRLAGPGAVFFAIHGERADGHDFIGDAFERRAVAAVVDQVADAVGQGRGRGVIEVANTGRALLALAADERRAMTAKVVGVTGANGKTSTKDLAAAVLGTRWHTHASPASFNNEIGVPLTILGAPEGSEALVCEMGARRLGDVSMLSDVVRPGLVVVTNVGLAHMELFGSWENIVAASAEPVEALDASGAAVLNADDSVVRAFAERTTARVLTFGTGPDADVRGEDVELDPDGRPTFSLAAHGDRVAVELAVRGEHMVSNALAAAACGIALGLTAAECAVALKEAQVSAWRMESFTTADGVRVVNDAYNANPESTAAGLKAARWMAGRGRMAAVLGHMAELGAIAPREHERVGEMTVRLGVDRLITVGERARPIALAALREGAPPENVASYDDPEEALADLRDWVRAGDVVLFKGSRVVGLERLAEAMR